MSALLSQQEGQKAKSRRGAKRKYTPQQRLIVKAVILSGGRLADVAEHVPCTITQAGHLLRRMGYSIRGR